MTERRVDSRTEADEAQLDRAVGTVLASAAGDALGSQYEFGPALPNSMTPAFGVGYFGHAAGEWTDDTSMAVAILNRLASGETLEDPLALAEIVAEWRGWARTAKDVGVQTRGILALLSDDADEHAARVASESAHRRSGRSGGNGSLMRTGPVALGYLDRSPDELVIAAGRVAQLTHWESQWRCQAAIGSRAAGSTNAVPSRSIAHVTLMRRRARAMRACLCDLPSARLRS